MLVRKRSLLLLGHFAGWAGLDAIVVLAAEGCDWRLVS